MAAPRHNEWLDIGESDQDDGGSGYDSEAAEDRKTATTRAKKRKLSAREEVEDEEADSDSEAGEASQPRPNRDGPSKADEANGTDDEQSEGAQKRPKFEPRRIKTPEPELHKDLFKTKTKSTKTGVVYLSRIPPFMKPQTVKHLLEPYGEIGRIFLTPEDPASHTKRVKSGGNKKRSFTDGWVEFQRKKHAKIVAETLNAQIIGGKKGGWYHDDVWNIKYLRGFKWHHLTEQIANENAERAARLRAEISQTSKENKRFVANVERAKMLEGMNAKSKQRAEPAVAGDNGASSGMPPAERPQKRRALGENKFRQTEVKGRREGGKHNEEVQRVLSKIF